MNSTVIDKPRFKGIPLMPELVDLLESAPSVTIAKTVDDLVDLAVGGPDATSKTVSYTLPNGVSINEAEVVRTKNGICANYIEAYMRRRDPDCMLIADDLPTDKDKFSDRYDYDFNDLRQETFDWLKSQDLAMFVFETGQKGMGYYAAAVVPANAGFFGLGLALLQGIINPDELPEDFDPEAVIYTAPVFRHTHFDGKQVVVHNRLENKYEMFAYNLYPGPSAKKGVYGMLIDQGEREGWVTTHCSAVKVITPYDGVVHFMHEGASGGGKSEMTQQPHRESEGSLLIGENIVTGEKRFLELARTCELHPVADDMALCHPRLQKGDGRLYLEDAENAWFVRVDHITEYGTDMDLERITAKPDTPLLFLSIDATPGSRAMIWEHTEDAPGVPCPNPRVVLPRHIVNHVISEPAPVDVRSMGLRTPPCTAENPSYGIVGILHVLPPALAWIWRLVAPRGFANPSIISAEGLSSEGVGSYWPFSTGKKVTQANLLLEQIVQTPKVKYILTPNQHLGSWKTCFMPQWISRDYLARRGGANFSKEQLIPARHPLLGYVPKTMKFEGYQIPRWFLEVNTQPEVGNAGYDAGGAELTEFFKKTLLEFKQPELSELGTQIIDCFLNGGTVEDFAALL